MRDRPSRLVTISFGIAASVVGIFLEQYGVSWKYSEIGFGTIILVFCLLSGFRPEWQRRRFWLVMAVIVVPHLTGWVYLANRIERFGFALGFILLIGEIVVGAGMIFKAIPEDYQVMVDYIYRR
jgi:hypothetical protein